MRDESLDRIIAAQPYPPKRNGGFRLEPRTVATIVAWIVTLAVAWGAVNTRIAVMEARQQENERRLQRIEDKVDLLLGRK